MFIETKARCFMEAAKCLNFTRAAEKLYISQPALSKNIAALEQECGMKLFYRDNRRNQVKLTPAGAVMLCEFQKMEEILDCVLEKARRAESGEEGRLVIALLVGQIINEITLQLLDEIEQKYPKIEIEKMQGGFRELRTWVEDGTADIVVTFEEEARMVKGLMYEEVQTVQLGFAVPVHHPFAGKRTLRVKDLEHQRVAVLDNRESAAVNERFREICRLQGISPAEISAADLYQLNMIGELGKGVVLTRQDSIITRSPNLKFFPSRELGTIRLVAAWRKDNLNPIINFYHRMYEALYHEMK